MLATSVVYNSWHSYRDGLIWYHERSAGKFMRRLGVTPEPAMSRAVYLSDVESYVAPTLENDTMSWFSSMTSGSSAETAKTCRKTFGEQLTASPSSANRLSRSRDAMARYRHDLLVALRVVNRVERDVVLAEWEEWVRSEERSCAKVEGKLQQRIEGKGKKGSVIGKEELEEVLGKDFWEYCQSCRDEKGRIANGTGVI